MKMDKKENIAMLEQVLNTQLSLLEQVNDLIELLIEHQKDYQSLLSYYDSPNFLIDVELSNKGYFNGIPCGILSEDGIFNLIFERRQTADRLEEASKLLRKN